MYFAYQLDPTVINCSKHDVRESLCGRLVFSLQQLPQRLHRNSLVFRWRSTKCCDLINQCCSLIQHKTQLQTVLFQGQEVLAQALATKNTEEDDVIVINSGVQRIGTSKTSYLAASAAVKSSTAVADATKQSASGGATGSKLQAQPGSGKGDRGETSGASTMKGSSKGSKGQGKSQDKVGGMKQATLGMFFGR